MQKILGAGLMLAMVCLAGCENQQQTGALLGGATGALLGSGVGSGSGRSVAIVSGAALGSFFGNEVGRSLDQADRMEMHNATEEALNKNQQRHWSSRHAKGYVQPRTEVHHHYHHDVPATAATPAPQQPTQPVHHAKHGRHCRSFTTHIKLAGREEWVQADGCACRSRGGEWHIRSYKPCEAR